MKTHDHFPMFIDAREKSVLIIGGGKIAERRIQTLSKFSFHITVLSKQLTDEIQRLCNDRQITYVPEAFDPEDPQVCAELLGNSFMVLACTDDRETNRRIGSLCRERGIQVNVCDAQEESTFWFPAVAVNDELVLGLTGDGTSHETVRKAAAKLRRTIEEKHY